MDETAHSATATILHATAEFDAHCGLLSTARHGALGAALDHFLADPRSKLIGLKQWQFDPTKRLYTLCSPTGVDSVEVLLARIGDVWVLGGLEAPMPGARFGVNLSSGRIAFTVRSDLLRDFEGVLGTTDWTNVDLVRAGVDPAVAASLMSSGSTVYRSLDPRLDADVDRALDLLEVEQATYRSRRGGRATKAEIVSVLDNAGVEMRRVTCAGDLAPAEPEGSTGLDLAGPEHRGAAPSSRHVTAPRTDSPSHAIVSTGEATADEIDPALLRRFEAEHERRGRLDADLVASICERRGLDEGQSSAVRAELEARGLLPKRKSAVVEGWEPPDAEDHYTPDLMSLYLAEVGAHQLLMPEDEVVLGRRIRAARELIARKTGREHSELREFLTTQRSLPELAEHERRIIQEGADAEERMFVCNLRLVISVARRVAWNHPRLEPLDFVQAGNMGLSRAIQKFDHRLGFKFSTYATWWIRQAITRELANHGRLIRLPVHVSDQLRRLRGAKRNLEIDLEREPSLSELAEYVGEDVGTVQAVLDYGQTVASLDKPLGDGHGTTLGALVEDCEAATAFDHLSRRMLASAVQEILHELTEREQEVIRLRFGLDDGRQRTLEEIGRQFGVTRERIRQIEAKTMKRLRQPSRANRLKDFLV